MVHRLWQGPVRRVVDKVWHLRVKSLAKSGFHSYQHKLPPELGIGRMHAISTGDRGDGPIWIFVHGFTSQALDWQPLLSQLTEDCSKIVAMDLPGHGQTGLPKGHPLSGDDVLEATVDFVRHEVPIERGCVVVGNSMGGLVTAKLTMRLRELVRGMVLISPFGAPYTDHEIDSVLEHFTLTDYQRAKNFVLQLFPNGVPPPGLRAMAIYMWAHFSRKHLVDLMPQARSYPMLTESDLAGMPETLLIWGTDDFILPSSGLEFFRKTLPKRSSTILTPARYNHMPFFEMSQHVANDIRLWAQTHKLF